MNAFFIIPTSVKSTFGSLFMTHPPLEKRLERLAADRAGDGPPHRRVGRPVGARGRPLRAQAPRRANVDRLFALSTAQVDPPGGAGPHVRRASRRSSSSRSLRASSCGPSRRSTSFWASSPRARDPRSGDGRTRLGYQWLVVRDPDFEDLVTGVNLVASELQARGFGEQLLAALFSFEGGERPTYLIYGFKTGTFWPFVPTGEEQERDNAEELRLKNELQGELPIERDLSRWLALFDPPLE